jgi:hypothetical protein
MGSMHFLLGRVTAARLGWLAAVLIFAQVGAVAHGYAHFGAAGHLSGAPAAAKQLCPDCLSFEAVRAVAGGATHAPQFATAVVDAVYRTIVAPVIGFSPQHAFRSRAPPLLA